LGVTAAPVPGPAPLGPLGLFHQLQVPSTLSAGNAVLRAGSTAIPNCVEGRLKLFPVTTPVAKDDPSSPSNKTPTTSGPASLRLVIVLPVTVKPGVFASNPMA